MQFKTHVLSSEELGFSFDKAGYYIVINIFQNPDTESFSGSQIAIGYYGGNAVGKIFIRLFANGSLTSDWIEYAKQNEQL